jgi:tetratricopeptide (TPR) repeat protein
MLHASLLGRLEFTLDGSPLTLPTGRALELLVFVASSPDWRSHSDLETIFGTVSDSSSVNLDEFAAFLEFAPDGVRFAGSSDVNAYRSLAGDLKALSKLRGKFCPDLTSSNPAFQNWLAAERFALRRIFLSALLQNAAQLAESGREREGKANLEFVQRESALLEPPFRAELSLELARYHWRLNQPNLTARILEVALLDLSGAVRDEAVVNLGAALVRVGQLEDAVALLESIVSGASHGWALAHRANAQRFAGRLEAAVHSADLAYKAAVEDEDGFLAVSALCVKGEALLEMAITAKTEPLEATIAFGKAFGITEMLGEESSAAPLAGLAHAHAVWGNGQKALEQAEKAFKRARAAKDNASVIRALLALYATTRIGSFARNALTEARAFDHAPLELLATLAVLEKDTDPTLAARAITLARLTGNAALETRAMRLQTVESPL